MEDMGLEMKIAQLAAHRLWSRLWHVSTGALLVIDAFLSQQAEARAAIKVSAGQGKGNSEEGLIAVACEITLSNAFTHIRSGIRFAFRRSAWASLCQLCHKTPFSVDEMNKLIHKCHSFKTNYISRFAMYYCRSLC